MDINKIFGAFDSSSNSGGFDNKSFNYYNPRNLPTLDENHPRYFIKMFYKLIDNHLTYSKKLINFFGSTDSSISTQEIEFASELMLYTKAYNLAKKIDIEDEYHQKILREENSKKLNKAYQMSIKFYEQREEYEKCAFLKKQLDYTKSLL